MGIERPENLTARRVDGAHDRPGRTDVDNTVHHDRLCRLPHRIIDLCNPRNAQTPDVLVVDLLQRAELLLTEASAFHEPVIALRFSSYTRVGHITWSRRRGRRTRSSGSEDPKSGYESKRGGQGGTAKSGP